MSQFYFGHFITKDNQFLPFNDGAGDKIATLKVGDYTLTTFVTEVQRALNDASSVVFSVSVNRTTRIITISGSGNFELQTTSGVASNCFLLLGFSGADKSGSNSYTGTIASGSFYRPQFLLQKFVAFGDDNRAVFSSVSKSASGQVQHVSFGDEELSSFIIPFATNITQGAGPIENQANGLDNLRTFLQYITKKRKIEFMPSRDLPGTFFQTILESSESSGTGTGYKLKEYFGKHMGYFSSGKLVFRRVL